MGRRPSSRITKAIAGGRWRLSIRDWALTRHSRGFYGTSTRCWSALAGRVRARRKGGREDRPGQAMRRIDLIAGARPNFMKIAH
jgi:hypothetical protein